MNASLSAVTSVLRTFEVTAAGFCAETSETDHLVFWVKASSSQEVLAVVEGTGAGFHDTIDAESDIDFVLPRDASLLKSTLNQIKGGAKRWYWQCGGQEGVVYAHDRRDALSRMLTLQQDNGKFFGQLLGVTPDVINEVACDGSTTLDLHLNGTRAVLAQHT